MLDIRKDRTKHFQPQDPKTPPPSISRLPELLMAIGFVGLLVTISVSVFAVWIILLTKNIAVAFETINLRYYLTYAFITLASTSSFGIFFYGAKLRKRQHLTGLDRKLSVSLVTSAALIFMYSVPSILLSTFAPIYQLTKEINYPQTQSPNSSTQQTQETGLRSDLDQIGADWQTFSNEEVGFEFKHPSSFQLSTESAFSLTEPTIYIWSEKIEGMNAPLGYTEENLRSDVVELEGGNFGDSLDFSNKSSERVVVIDGKNAKDYLVFRRFETCDMTMERTLIFYKDDFITRMVVSLPVSVIEEKMSEYIIFNSEECSGYSQWDYSKRDRLASILIQQKADPDVQSWYNTFDQILSTFRFTN